MNKKSKKIKNLDVLDEKINELESTLNDVSTDLYGGKELSEEQILELKSKLKDSESISAYVDEAVTLNLKSEREFAKKTKFVLGTAISVDVLLALTGAIIPAGLAALVQVMLAGIVKKNSQEIVEHLKQVSTRSSVAGQRLSNYQTSANVKMKKLNKDFSDLSDTDLKIAKYSLAEDAVQSLLHGAEVGQLDADVALLAKEMLKDYGAEGETLEDLASDLKTKIAAQRSEKTVSHK